jgi:hypothetical protein
MFFQIYDRLLSLEEKYSTRTFTPSDFTKIIRRQFPAADFSFRTQRDYAVDPDMVLVAGIYDCYNDAQGLPHTEISLCYHPKQNLYIGSTLNWKQISFDIAECIGHELIHRVQYQQRIKLKPYVSKHTDEQIANEQEYLGSEEELDAYGFSIAAESIVFSKDYHDCKMYQVYVTTFDNDHSVVVKLEKEIVKYIIQLEHQYEQVSPST